MKILHITDFHVDNPDGSNENLRNGFYNEFIDGLFNIIHQNGLGKIDLIINTGDFVNQGKTENFSHSKEILNYIIKKSDLSADDIAVCIGNHDFKMKETGTRNDKIKAFNTFSEDLKAGVLIENNERATLYERKQNDSQVLIIDNASRVIISMSLIQ